MGIIYCVLHNTCKLRECDNCFYTRHVDSLINTILTDYANIFLENAKNTLATQENLYKFTKDIYNYISVNYPNLELTRTPDTYKYMILQDSPSIHLTYQYFPHLKSQGYTVYLTLSANHSFGKLNVSLQKMRIKHLQTNEDMPCENIHTQNSWGTYYTVPGGCDD